LDRTIRYAHCTILFLDLFHDCVCRTDFASDTSQNHRVIENNIDNSIRLQLLMYACPHRSTPVPVT